MKLFSPSEAKTLNNAQIERDKARIRSTKDELGSYSLKLADAEASFNAALARHRERWAKEEEEYAIRKDTMEKEALLLEKRKAQALIPIAEIEEKAHTILTEAERKLSSVLQQETEIEELKESLFQTIDEYSEKESSLEKEHGLLERRKKAVQEEEAMISLNRKNLSESIITFNAYVQGEQGAIAREKTSIFLRERSLESRNDMLAKREKRLEADTIRLNDGRETLKRAFARINMSNLEDTVNYPNVEVQATENGTNQPTASTVSDAVDNDTASSTDDVSHETPEIPVETEQSEEIPASPQEEAPIIESAE